MGAGGRSTPAIRQAILTADIVFVSAASAWEIAIKVALGKLQIPEPVSAGVAHAGFEELPITMRHAEIVSVLPPLHADPFDRLLVAQTVALGLTLVTADDKVRAYEAPILWAG